MRKERDDFESPLFVFEEPDDVARSRHRVLDRNSERLGRLVVLAAELRRVAVGHLSDESSHFSLVPRLGVGDAQVRPNA